MRLLLALPLLAALLPVPAFAELRHAGNVTQTTVNGTRVTLALDGGAVAQLEILARDVLRVRFAPGGTLSTFQSGALSTPGAVQGEGAIADTTDAVYIVTTRFTAAVLKQPYRLVVWRPDGSVLQADLSPAVTWDTETGTIYTRKWAQPEERYYGFGERGGPLDRRGRAFAMRNQDLAAFNALSDPLYISIPYFWGAVGAEYYGVFLDNPAVPFFDADTGGDGTLAFGAMSGDLDYYLMPGPEPARITEAYGHLTGFSMLPPRWTLGYHQSRYGYRTQDEILQIANTFRTLQVPADALYFDIDYLDRLQMFSWNTDAFPNPWVMNHQLGQLGFKRVNIMEPLVHTGDRFWAPLAGAGFFLKKPWGDPVVTDIWFGSVSFLDFTKSAAREWYRNTLAWFLSTGIDAVWNDLNEPAANYMPDAVYDFDGQPRYDLHARNLYALKMAEDSYAAQAAAKPDTRPWGISRAGFAGIQRYIANWGGDALSDWETLRTNVQMSLSMGLSGQNFFGHDIGGFLGAPDAELFTRWMEFSAFTPLFRNHAMNTSPAREPWAFGEPTLSIAREIINERYRLLPYLYTLFERTSRDGTPSLAPPFYWFPADPALRNDDSMFMVGRDMLVAPVLWQGATSRAVYLPAGAAWYEAATGARHPGGAYAQVDAPIGQPPVFMRSPSIVTKGPVMQHTGERPLTEIDVHLYPAAGTFDTTFTMYEDDGSSFAYRVGAFVRTRISYGGTGTGKHIEVERVEGSMVPAAGRTWTFELHDVPGATGVTAGGQALPQLATRAGLAGAPAGWAIDAGRLLVKVADAAALAIDVTHAETAP